MRPFKQVFEIDNLSVTGDKSPVAFKAFSKSFTLSNAVDPSQYTFTVIYENGFELWAKGQVETSIPYIRAVSAIFGVPPMSHSLGMVQARGKYFIEGGAAYNSRGVVYQKADNALFGVLSSHELAHNWQHMYGKQWNEGFDEKRIRYLPSVREPAIMF